MQEKDLNLKEIIQDSRILEEKQKLLKIYKDIPKDKLLLLDGLIDEAAFLKCALTQCKIILQNEGLHTTTENGSQSFVKSHPITKTYSDYMKQYDKLTNDLLKLIPEQPTPNNQPTNITKTPRLDRLRGK